ncbi:MAG: tetratricopeptide repeat protein, partial [Acidobacteriota bacterium]
VLWGVTKRQAWAFAGAWFFLILSVTSSFMPYSDLVFEHRMYLPLAGVVSIVVIGGYQLGKRGMGRLKMAKEQRLKLSRVVALAIAAIVISALVFQTLRRNVDYRSQMVIWTDTVNKRPENGRAHSNLGKSLVIANRFDEALLHFEIACKYDPGDVAARHNLGQLLIDLGRIEEGKSHLEKVIRLRPNYSIAHRNLGRLFASEGKTDLALSHFLLAIQSDPNNADAYFYLAQTMEKLGRTREACDNYLLALKFDPHWSLALSHYARLLSSQDDPQLRNTGEAVKLAERAVALTQRQDPFDLETLALVYAESGRFDDAVRVSQETLALAEERNELTLAANMKERIKLYQAGRARSDSH